MTFQELLQEAKKLTAEERRKLKRELDSLEEPGVHRAWPSGRIVSEEERLAAMKSWLEMSGTGHSDYTDVSSDKYKHLAEIYADNHEDDPEP